MKTKVIEFLNATQKTPVDRYNEALQLFMNSKNCNRATVNYYNAQGYSPKRLEELIYDLKKSNEITVADLSKHKSLPKKSKTLVISNSDDTTKPYLEFSKGIKGYHERKAYVKKYNIETEGTKTVDLDIAINKHLESLKNLEVVTSLETDNVDNTGNKNLKSNTTGDGSETNTLDEKLDNEGKQ